MPHIRRQQALACLVPFAVLLLVSSTQGLPEGGQIPKADSLSDVEQSLASIGTGPSAQTLQSMRDARIMTASALRNLLTAMARVAGTHPGVAGGPSQWLALQPHVHRLVPYLKVHGPGGKVLDILRTLLRDYPNVQTLLTHEKELLELAQAFDPTAFLHWVSAARRHDKAKQPGGHSSGGRRQKKASPKKSSKPKHTSPPKNTARSPRHAAPKKPHATTVKHGPIGNDPNDPVDQLYDWARRVKALGGSVKFLAQGEARRRSRSLLAADGDYKSDTPLAMNSSHVPSQAATARQLRGAPRAQSAENMGFGWFKPRRIGVVFHMLQFRDKRNYLYPPQVYWNGDEPAKRMLDTINKVFRYSGANIQFYVQDYRINVGMHPYLDMGNLSHWQDCGNTVMDCTCHLAKHNYQAHKYINVYVAGSNAYRGSNNTDTVATTSAIAGYLDQCQPVFYPQGGDTWDWGQKYSTKSQHIWMGFDYVDPLQYNSAEQLNYGATALAHEIGHALGLLHTFQPVYVLDAIMPCVDGDMVRDTPPDDKNGTWQNSSLYYKLSGICMDIAYTGKLPKREQLAKFDSCPGNAYIDNVFNVMNYLPTPCKLMITRGQVRFMQQQVTQYLKSLGDS